SEFARLPGRAGGYDERRARSDPRGDECRDAGGRRRGVGQPHRRLAQAAGRARRRLDQRRYASGLARCATVGGRRADEAGNLTEIRTYPTRPFLAVSAAIVRDGKVLVVRRARQPALNLYTLPGGVVEAGETMTEAVIREVR